MIKLKMPRAYVSPSQVMLYERDPLEYYQQYFVARVDWATMPMKFGKIFQEAWCDKKYKYIKELTKAGFTSDFIRVIKAALAHPDTMHMPKSMTEEKIEVQTKKMLHPWLGILDGYNKKTNILLENKMGAWWTQKMVDESIQLTWYMLVIKIKYGKVPKTFLQSFNSKNGIPRIFPVKRTIKDFNLLIERVNQMVMRVQAGDFEKY